MEPALAITARERDEIARHRNHRWTDITDYSILRRKLLCLDCEVSFDAGEAKLAITEPIESEALRKERSL